MHLKENYRPYSQILKNIRIVENKKTSSAHYHIYILRCGDGSLYTGWTNNVAKRVAEHTVGKGAKYTRSRLPVELVYQEMWASKQNAMRREREIKDFSHKNKINLISKHLFSNSREFENRQYM